MEYNLFIGKALEELKRTWVWTGREPLSGSSSFRNHCPRDPENC